MQTPEFSYASTEPFFDPIEEDIEKNQYYNDLWRKSANSKWSNANGKSNRC